VNETKDDETGVTRDAEGDDGPLDPEEWGDPVPDVIEPGRPKAENVAFVLLGVLAAVYVVARIAGLV